MNTDMTPIDWAKRPLQKYTDFTGRAPRAEYWWFFLGLVVSYIVLSIIESVVGINKIVLEVYGPLTVLLWLATLAPSIAVGVRRLHDTGRSGWWILLPIVPYCIAFAMGGSALAAGNMAGAGLAMIFLMIGFVAAILLLVFMVLPGTSGDNRYGPNPYGIGDGSAVAAE